MTLIEVIVTDVYAASEDPIEGIDSLTFANELKEKLTYHVKIFQVPLLMLLKNYSLTLKSGDIVVGLEQEQSQI